MAESEGHADPLIAQYVRSISSTEGAGISMDNGNAYVVLNPVTRYRLRFQKAIPADYLSDAMCIRSCRFISHAE